ncbi:MAG: ubiquinol-cytochrome c reductase iron-sulfur subunit [Paracoccaceae bacterium]
MSDTLNHPPGDAAAPDGKDATRRDFLYYSTGAAATVATGAAIWPLLDAMNPTADVKATALVEVDLEGVLPGARITVRWSKRPVFIDRRTPERIALARVDDNNMSLIDPATDAERAQRSEWLVQIGICTHLGCIPLGQNPGDPTGDWEGWFCVCHGSVYDSAGRVRRGPAPRNLDLPPYEWLTDTQLRIGTV